MAQAENLRQNLIDAGCSEAEANRCLTFAEKGEWNKLCNTLAKQKAVLLTALHKSERQIDCLDFLVYEINKKYINGGKQND
ncbi:MAG: hypothetical protein J1E98_10400 [Lachnospiraceae bacterium]|nr:hypothetical protein [Lachnospiraceae bacterium]